MCHFGKNLKQCLRLDASGLQFSSTFVLEKYISVLLFRENLKTAWCEYVTNYRSLSERFFSLVLRKTIPQNICWQQLGWLILIDLFWIYFQLVLFWIDSQLKLSPEFHNIFCDILLPYFWLQREFVLWTSFLVKRQRCNSNHISFLIAAFSCLQPSPFLSTLSSLKVILSF